MKKLLCVLLTLALLFALAACAQNEETSETPAAAPETPAPDTPAPETPAPLPGPVAEEVRGVTIPVFEVFVNGVPVTSEMMAAYPVYSVLATSVNSSGNESTANYIGFAVSDVIDAAGLSGNFIWLEAMAGDGYSVLVKGDAVLANTTLLAMTKDGSPFNEAPWLAPCTETVTGSYLKGTLSILVNTEDSAPGGQHILDGG